jgi:AcrR family transcriptional regulator
MEVPAGADVKMGNMDSASLRTYGGVAGKERAAERRSQIMEAGLELLGAPDGVGELTVRGICRQTGLTARYFYESFSDREALTVAVYDQVVKELTAAVLDAVAAAPHTAAEQTRAGLAMLVRQIAADPRHGRLLFSRALSSSPIVAARRVESTRWFVELFAAQVRAFYGVERAARVDVAAELLVGGLAQVLTSWLDGVLTIEEAELVDHCARLFLAVGRDDRPS